MNLNSRTFEYAVPRPKHFGRNSIITILILSYFKVCAQNTVPKLCRYLNIYLPMLPYFYYRLSKNSLFTGVYSNYLGKYEND